MKKIALTIMTFAVLASCGGNKKQEAENADNVSQSTEVLEQPVNDGHNAKSSLDYKGIYKGTLPEASGSGMAVTVELKDSTYTRTTVYSKAKDKANVEEGTYKWNDEGSIVTLDGSEPANQYFVGENMLYALDLEGKRIEGDLADKYILKKE